MAWSSSPLSARDAAGYAAGYPIVLAHNACRPAYADSVYSHRWNLTGSFATADGSAAGHELSVCAGDGATHVLSYPSLVSTLWYALFAFESPGIEFDTIALLNTNLDENIGFPAIIEVQLDNSYTFPSPTQASYNLTYGSGWKRLMFLDTNRYSGVEFLRLRIVVPSMTPEVGEVFIGRRRQLQQHPRLGFDHQNLVSTRKLGRTPSGVLTPYSLRQGQRVMDVSLPCHRDDDVDDIEGLYETDTSFGSDPVLWLDSPTSSFRQDFSMMHFDPPELVGQYSGPSERQFSFRLVEQGPDYIAQEQTWHI